MSILPLELAKIILLSILCESDTPALQPISEAVSLRTN